MSITKCTQATGGTEVLTGVIPCTMIPSQAPFSQIPPAAATTAGSSAGLAQGAEIARSYSEKSSHSHEPWDRGI